MFLRIWLSVSHTYIFFDTLICFIAFLFIISISGIGDKWHFSHFNNGYCRKMVIHLYRSQQQITSTSLKRIFCEAIRKMCGIEIFAFSVYPCSEVHHSLLVGTCFLEIRYASIFTSFLWYFTSSLAITAPLYRVCNRSKGEQVIGNPRSSISSKASSNLSLSVPAAHTPLRVLQTVPETAAQV